MIRNRILTALLGAVLMAIGLWVTLQIIDHAGQDVVFEVFALACSVPTLLGGLRLFDLGVTS